MIDYKNCCVRVKFCSTKMFNYIKLEIKRCLGHINIVYIKMNVSNLLYIMLEKFRHYYGRF